MILPEKQTQLTKPIWTSATVKIKDSKPILDKRNYAVVKNAMMTY